MRPRAIAHAQADEAGLGGRDAQVDEPAPRSDHGTLAVDSHPHARRLLGTAERGVRQPAPA